MWRIEPMKYALTLTLALLGIAAALNAAALPLLEAKTNVWKQSAWNPPECQTLAAQCAEFIDDAGYVTQVCCVEPSTVGTSDPSLCLLTLAAPRDDIE